MKSSSLVTIGTALLGLLLGAPVAQAQDDSPSIVVTPGKVRAFRVAVQRFADLSQPPEPERAEALRRGVEEALTFSGVLVPLDHKAFLGSEKTTALPRAYRVDCGTWTQSGADALVEGELESQNGELVAVYQVWDTARCVRLARGEIRRPLVSETRLARLVADAAVEAFTGTRGVAATEIAFISDRTGDREVFVIDAMGTSPRPATNSRTIKAFPDWLPNGDAILYTAYQSSGLPGLFLTSRGRVKAGALLARVLPEAAKYRGVFAPDGESLALVASQEGQTNLYRVARNGRGLRTLTRGTGLNLGPSWSPDGQRIAFVSDRSGAPHIYVMNADGTGVRRLTYQGSYNTSPAWSPDGRWIAYESRLESQFDIWLIDPEGESNLPVVSHPRSDEGPSWSPDSRKIVFSSSRRGRKDLYVVDLDGRNLRRLTRSAGDNTQPAWGPFQR